MEDKEGKWIQTKKECEVDEVGNFIVKRVTLEIEKKRSGGLERKDIIDLILRLVGLLAIGIPVLLFYFQQKAERDKQRALLQIEVYSDASMQLHQLLNDEHLSSSNFEAGKNKVHYEYYPKIVLYNRDERIMSLLREINRDLTYYSFFRNLISKNDSINSNVNSIVTGGFRIIYFRNPFTIKIDNEKLNSTIVQHSRNLNYYKILSDLDRKYFYENAELTDSTWFRFRQDFLNRNLQVDSIRRKVLDGLSDYENLRKQFDVKRDNKRHYHVRLKNAIIHVYRTRNDLLAEATYLAEVNVKYNRHIDGLVHKMDSIFIQSNRFLRQN